MMKTIALATMLLAATPLLAQGVIDTAGQLLDKCQSDNPAIDNVCLTYLLGFTDGHAIVRELTGQRLFCLPERVSVAQGKAVFVRWAEQNPDRWHIGTRVALAVALADAFPCDESESDDQ